MYTMSGFIVSDWYDCCCMYTVLNKANNNDNIVSNHEIF